MSAIKVSVIIPVRNQEKHLSTCLESVINQTLKSIEIIIVEGGSTDRSIDIIHNFMDKDNRIRLINKAGEGLPLARKAGLQTASGEYIYHLDGDDTLELNALELLYNRANETDADMVVLNFLVHHTYNNSVKESSSLQFVRLCGIDFIRTLYLRQNYWMVWSVFHKRSLSSTFEIRFDAKLFLGEDTLLTTQLAYYSKKIVKLNSEPLLHHYIHKAPEEKKLSFSRKSYFDLNKYPDLIYEFLKDKPEYPLLEESLACLKLQSIVRSFNYKYLDCAAEKSREALNILKQHPQLNNISGARMKKIFHAYSLNEKLGRLMTRFFL